MIGSNPFNLPMPQGVLKTLGAETIRVFEQQGQQGGQGGGGQGNPCEDTQPSSSQIREKYADSTNEFYLYTIENGWGNDVQVVQWQGSTPTQAQKNNYLAYLRYMNKKNRNALPSSCIAQAQANYSNPGFQVLFPTSGLWGDKKDTNPTTGVRIYEQTWKGAKAQHEGAFAGCMESTASNYNPNAATDNSSCVWTWQPYQVSTWGRSKAQTKKTSDGFRYIWEVDSMEEQQAYNGSDYKLRGIWKISKVCEEKYACGEPSTEMDMSKRTLPSITIQTGQIGYPNGLLYSNWNAAKATAKAAGQTAIDTLFANHVAPVCRDGSTTVSNWSGFIPQPCDNAFTLTVKRSLTFCAGSGNDWKRATYTLYRNGVAQNSWPIVNDDDYSLSVSNAIMNQHMNSSTGNYSWIDGAQQIVDSYDASLASTIKTEKYVINGWTRAAIPENRIINYDNKNYFLKTSTKEITTNACGSSQKILGSMLSIYPFTAASSPLNPNPKPTVSSLVAGGNTTLTVKMDDVVLTPSQTFDISNLSNAEIDALVEPFYAKIGCMDATAENYDPTANTNAKQGGNSAACKWNCTEDDGRGLMRNCKTCLPIDGVPQEAVFNVSTNTWSCPSSGGGDDGETDEDSSILDKEWLPFAAIGGLILLALGMG